MGYGDLLYLNKPGKGHKPAAPKPNPGVAPGTGGSTATPQIYTPPPLQGVSAGGAIDQMRIKGVGATTTTSNGDGGGGGGGTYTPPPPTPKPVNPWITTSNYIAPVGIKQADPSIVLFADRPISPEYMLELEYESISGMELINISRSDLINGQEVIYSPIKNLSLIRRRYNPINIINLSELSASFFSRFAIDLIERGMKQPYFDDEGNLIIEIENVRDDEVIETEIDNNATIKEVTFE